MELSYHKLVHKLKAKQNKSNYLFCSAGAKTEEEMVLGK